MQRQANKKSEIRERAECEQQEQAAARTSSTSATSSTCMRACLSLGESRASKAEGACCPSLTLSSSSSSPVRLRAQHAAAASSKRARKNSKPTKEANNNNNNNKDDKDVELAAAAAAANEIEGSRRENNKVEGKSEESGQKIKYWHYKQTGIRSRPIKLLKHPIEHIERKIILTCLLSSLFKLIAILTGPLIVLIVYLITVPFTLLRRTSWFLLNVRCFCDARIKTHEASSGSSSSSDGEEDTDDDDCAEQNDKHDAHYDAHTKRTQQKQKQTDQKQVNWNYCPLTFIETYWFKKRLVNTVILVIDNNNNNNSTQTNNNNDGESSTTNFCIDKFKSLIRDQVLVRPLYRKFLSRVVSRGIPFYKSHYWHYLGLDDQTSMCDEDEDDCDDDDDDDDDEDNDHDDDCDRDKDKSGLQQKMRLAQSDKKANSWSSSLSKSNSRSSISSSQQQFSTSSFSSSSKENLRNCLEQKKFEVRISMPPAPKATSSALSAAPSSSSSQRSLALASLATTTTTNSEGKKRAKKEKHRRRKSSESQRVDLRTHIFIDHSLDGQQQQQQQQQANKAPLSLAQIRRHAHHLIDIALNPHRPLWEVRVIPSQAAASSSSNNNNNNKKTYLILRCHQCLADGKTLSKLLTDNLAAEVVAPAGGELEKHEEPVHRRQRCCVEKGQADGSSGEVGVAEDDVGEEDKEEDNKEVEDKEEKEKKLRVLREKRSFVSRMSRANSIRGAIFVGPLTVLLWIIWTFSRRKHNHLSKCASKLFHQQQPATKSSSPSSPNHHHHHQQQQHQTTNSTTLISDEPRNERRFYMTHYDLTKFYQIKQMTRSTVSDVILCALSGAIREYLRKFNGVSNPPNLNASIAVDMRQTARNNIASCKLHQQSNKSAHTNTSQSQVDTNAAQVNCTLVNVSLPVSVEGTVPRLWEMRNTMDELRTSADPWVMMGLQRFLFKLLPVPIYRALVNFISLRNSSALVSNLHGPKTMVESWCVDLFQRALWEAQQQPGFNTTTVDGDDDCGDNTHDTGSAAARAKSAGQLKRRRLAAARHELNKQSRLKLKHDLGWIKAIYYCMQAPTSDIPISFNCITYHNKLFVTAHSRSLLVEDSKLLIKLFFKQLNQLANTIAKRRTLVTIIRTPSANNNNVEISCQPASPVCELDESKRFAGALVAATTSEFAHPKSADKEHELFEARPNFDESANIFASKAANSVGSSTLLFDHHHHHHRLACDDLDVASVHDQERALKCAHCQQVACSCQRRKSLFSFDQQTPITNDNNNNNKQLRNNSLNLVVVNQLHPSHSVIVQSVHTAVTSNEAHTNNLTTTNNQQQQQQQQQQSQDEFSGECTCNQLYLGSVDEEQFGAMAKASGMKMNDVNDDDDVEIMKVAQEPTSSSTDRAGYSSTIQSAQSTSNHQMQLPQRHHFHRHSSTPRATCCMKSQSADRSSLSLNVQESPTTERKQSARQQQQQQLLGVDNDDSMSRRRSNASMDEPKRRVGAALGQLVVPEKRCFIGDKLHSKPHSKSETDLLPASSILNKHQPEGNNNQRGLRDSWFSIGKKNNPRKHSLFSRSNFLGQHQQQSTSSRSNTLHFSSTLAPRSRHFMDTPVELIYKHFGDSSKRRRRSLAATSGTVPSAYNQQRSVVIKDEINADVNLRYHLDSPFFSIRNRRFSTIGSAVVANQRRTSLIPFGLMHNNSFPKLFCDDNEAHL